MPDGEPQTKQASILYERWLVELDLMGEFAVRSRSA